MNKQELVNAITHKTGCTKKLADQVISAFTETVRERLVAGEPVVLVGFGTFEIRHQQERAGRNPKTGEQIAIAARTVARFSPGKQLREAVEDVEIGNSWKSN